MVAGGKALQDGIDAVLQALGQGPLIFNLGHGITPQADPENVTLLCSGCVALELRHERRKTDIHPFWKKGGLACRHRALRLPGVHSVVIIRRSGRSLSLDQGASRHRRDSWMAAIFYLPRLFIYHTDAPAGSQQSETFKVMEQRLIRSS